MKRTIVSALAGAILGGIIFFPPSIPITFTLTLGLDGEGFRKYSQALDFIFVIFPAIGVFTGAIIGGCIGRKKVSLAPFRRKSYSILFWCIALFSLIGLELGFTFSWVTLIGLGNTSTWVDLWVFSFMLGLVRTILGTFVGFFAFVIFY
jgi:hypothetical protein